MGQLTGKAQVDHWAALRELVIVPDGLLWYLPFEALPAPGADQYESLLMRLPVRYAPLLSLAVSQQPARRDARAAVLPGKLLARDDEAMAQAGAEAIAAAAGNAAVLRRDLPEPAASFAATIDRLIVLTDIEDTDKVPAAWAPLVYNRGSPGATLADWLSLPLDGVDQIVLPGFHTAAESGLKRGGNGDEVFLTACSLMASGCRTALISRWRVGGQSTLDLVREFVQELPHQPASAAWRRSVQLASERTIDPAFEGRVRTSGREGVPAGAPFFWSGYLLLDAATKEEH
jgi:CHAT domain-containing protein